ncbi:class A rhodopsin-like G-protein coupled receptor GPRoar3, putative [Pediculus humanus corporis]|uniref:Class A rhodopsin-like G-protein coupled receptor GPRoar3, putative n=1 Tax=Pediculus humanus subsp. corporis TaxID=121224 RepID=E0VUZ6_PEDHC|nr:class A rhodopsin-like G-protein coupled receptor GPRoar3, putative [Pediculus humanus corporis]EEB17202.1 class A rhodopsin-like G-protein coupled receptor GPRoar3, putative [Pediculus humanus corporis]
MNESEACDSLITKVNWTDAFSLLVLAILLLINVMVVVGNCLVIAAVYISSKLRTVTNLFIVSLAVADLMVGVAVLPFSATWEVFKVWIFGDLWCSIWLAVDVWMCTASILNLCAISLDRYVAVTRPVNYPSIMSSSRAKILIAGVWVLSFVICFPPLVHNFDTSDDVLFTTTTPTTTTPQPTAESFQCPWICELTSDTGYVIYSALGSFFIPMGVMLFFYWKIYRAAVQTTRAINQGFRTTKGSGGFGNRFDEQRLTLRIHRGRGSVQSHSNTSTSITSCGSISGSPSVTNGHDKITEVPRLNRTRLTRTGKSHEKIKISVSYPSSDQISTSVMNNNNGLHPPSSPEATIRKTNESSLLDDPKDISYSVHYTNRTRKDSTTGSTTNGQKKLTNQNCYLRVTGSRLLTTTQSSKTDRSLSIDSMTSGYDDDRTCTEDASKDMSPSPTFDDGHHSQKPKHVSKMGKRNIKTQVKRFRMETKAAKTLGIIVGGFILCWMPFFTMYLIRPFCPKCINPIMFSVLFWLGYCNSAINPCIYALFSKDFRFAFKKIICRFLCGPERKLSVSLKRRGSDGSQMTTHKVIGRQRSPSFIPPNSMGEDSDPGASDSR